MAHRPDDLRSSIFQTAIVWDKSIWSKTNREKALVLIASGDMKAAGLEAIEGAKENGRWDAAYNSPSGAMVPSDFYLHWTRAPWLRHFFKTLDRANRYAVLWRIQTAKKAETRTRKIEQTITMLETNKRFIPDLPETQQILALCSVQ